MAKILTDEEMGQIIYDATHSTEMTSSVNARIECSDSYEHFLEDLGELIASHFGGERGAVAGPGADLSWTCGFQVNDCVPSDGGVFQDYDTDVIWKDGEEGIIMSLTIEEFLAKRQKLEDDIRSLLIQFEAETEIMPKGVLLDLTSAQRVGDRRPRYRLIGVRVGVDI